MRQEGARQGDELLLAAAEPRRAAAQERRHLGEECRDEVEPIRDVPSALRPRRDEQVVVDGEDTDEPPVLGHVADPERAAPMRRQRNEILAVQEYLSRGSGHEPHDGPERRRLAGAVPADEADGAAGHRSPTGSGACGVPPRKFQEPLRYSGFAASGVSVQKTRFPSAGLSTGYFAGSSSYAPRVREVLPTSPLRHYGGRR